MALIAFYSATIMALFFINNVVAQTPNSQKKCGLPEDISILPDFAQDEIRAVWKDYVPGTKCDKELLITEDILAVLEMFDKEFEQQKAPNERNEKESSHTNGGSRGEPEDYGGGNTPTTQPPRSYTDYVDLNEKERNTKNMVTRKDIPPPEPLNVPSSINEKVKQPTHPPSIPPPSTRPRPTRPPPTEFTRPTAPIIPDPPTNSATADEAGSTGNESGNGDSIIKPSNSYNRDRTGRPGSEDRQERTGGVSWRVKSSSSHNARTEDRFDADGDTLATRPKQGKSLRREDQNEEIDRPHRFGIMRNVHQYDADYVNPPQQPSEENPQGRSRSSKPGRPQPINTSDNFAQQDFNYDANIEESNGNAPNSLKQLDENLPFLRDADEDVAQIFHEVLNDNDLPSEYRRMEELHLLAVSYLNERQLKAFDVWATKRRKMLKNQDAQGHRRSDAEFRDESSRGFDAAGRRANLSAGARKALSALTHDVIESDTERQARIARLSPAVRSELRAFSQSLLARRYNK